MKSKIVSLLTAAVLVLALSPLAKADSVCNTSSTPSCSIDLTVTNGNTGQPVGTVYGTVSLTLNNDWSITVGVSINNGWTLHNADFGFNGTNGGTLSVSAITYNFAGSR